MSENLINQLSQNILKEAENNQGNTPSPSFIKAFNDVAKESGVSSETRLAVIESFPNISSPSGAGFIGIWLGGAVENGADPEPHIPALMNYFTKLIKHLSIIDEELEDTPENDERLTGLEFLGQALVAHLSRSQKHRDEIVATPETIQLLEDFDGYSPGITWVYELLTKHTEELIVLHVESKTGVRVRYENLSNCFHLFTLLQQTLKDIIPYEIEDEGEEDDKGSELDAFTFAWWHYGQGNVPHSGLEGVVWGEMSPREICHIDGVQVLLLWPMIMASRSWDEGFLHPVLEAAPANIKLLETFSDEEVDVWFKRLQINEGQTSA